MSCFPSSLTISYFKTSFLVCGDSLIENTTCLSLLRGKWNLFHGLFKAKASFSSWDSRVKEILNHQALLFRERVWGGFVLTDMVNTADVLGGAEEDLGCLNTISNHWHFLDSFLINPSVNQKQSWTIFTKLSKVIKCSSLPHIWSVICSNENPSFYQKKLAGSESWCVLL
jgi:hypothetical protein